MFCIKLLLIAYKSDISDVMSSMNHRQSKRTTKDKYTILNETAQIKHSTFIQENVFF